MADSSAKNAPQVYLLDAMGLIFRAHYALGKNMITTSSGFNSTALYVMTNTLLDLLEKRQPTHLAMVYDTAEPTLRHEEYADYKADREEMPEDLAEALPHLRRLVEAFRIPALELDGYEADDIIGTLAKRYAADGAAVYMVTQDKDFGQVVGDGVLIYKPSRMGDGVDILDAEAICKKWDIARPEQVIDVLGLMGDTSDSIPGVPGIGQKTAAKLLNDYDSIDGILDHVGELKGKLKERMEDNADLARLSRKLATIELDVPLDVPLTKLKRQEMDSAAMQKFCVEFEFNTIGKRLFGEGFQAGRGQAPAKKAPAGELDFGAAEPAAEPMIEAELETIATLKPNYQAVTDAAGRQKLIAAIKKEKHLCFDLETTSLDAKTAEIVGLAVALKPGEAWFVVWPEAEKEAAAVLEEFRPVFEDAKIEKTGHNLKYDVAVLRWHGVRTAGRLFDTMIAHALQEPDQRHQMDFLAQSLLGYRPVPISDLIGEKKSEQLSMREVPLDQLTDYACEDADVTLRLRQVLEPLLEEQKLTGVFHDIECPLLPVLVEMEHEGVRVDPDVLAEFSKKLEKEIARLEKEIYGIAGTEFNLNSPKQLGEILFDKLQISIGGAKPKKTKTGQYSTNEQTLTALAPHAEIVQHILDYREVSKLKSTYVDALPSVIHEATGRIHTTFHQVVTATGRLNSTDPNLQNIPIRTALGREIRKAFVSPDEQHVLLSADYSQIELRVIAALSGDPGMLEAFENGTDIHATTASKVYGVALGEVTSEMRRKAKMVNFGIIYGISAFGLAQRLGIPRQEAGDIINAYLHQYPGVARYMQTTIEEARQTGQVETVSGRRRKLRDIASRNQSVRAAAERTAINTPIQGSSADMIKIAMIKIAAELEKRGLASRMILQVHDELVFEVPKPEQKEVEELVTEAMKHALPELKVPIVVETGTGANWLDAH
ncbi:MAG: DNA polymerase I [Verrucomicrobiota bacterium]